MYDATPIIKAIITLIGVLITYVLIPYIKSKTSISQQEEINKWVEIAVAAAQQLYRGDGRGKEKKEYVINWLAERNIKYDAAKIDAMIEAAVYKLKQNGLIAVEGITID